MHILHGWGVVLKVLGYYACTDYVVSVYYSHMHKCETMATMASVQEQLKIELRNKTLMLNNASVHKEQTYSM